MDKTDLSKEYKDVYAASDKKPKLVDVPELNFLKFDGRGLPDRTPDFGNAMGALYSTAFTLKFALKAKGRDFKVMAPETVWKVGEKPEKRDPKDWEFTAMIPVPDFVTKADFEKAKASVKERSQQKKQPAPAVDRLRLERSKEGKCVQMMQFGPYEKATATYEKLKAFAEESGYKISGDCREIYYNDPHKVKPEKIKTLVRYPVSKV